MVAGEESMAQLTAAWLEAQQYAVVNDSTPVTVDMSQVTGNALRTAPMGEVMARPSKQLWTELSNGIAFDVALGHATKRLVSIVNTNMQLASTHTVQKSNAKGAWFDRVLTGNESCGMCVLASARPYRRGNLMAIHPGCDCKVRMHYRPYSDADEARHQAIVEGLQSADSGYDGPRPEGHKQFFTGLSRQGNPHVTQTDWLDYSEMIVEHKHGDIGPVLGWRHQAFTDKTRLIDYRNIGKTELADWHEATREFDHARELRRKAYERIRETAPYSPERAHANAVLRNMRLLVSKRHAQQEEAWKTYRALFPRVTVRGKSVDAAPHVNF